MLYITLNELFQFTSVICSIIVALIAILEHKKK